MKGKEIGLGLTVEEEKGVGGESFSPEKVKIPKSGPLFIYMYI